MAMTYASQRKDTQISNRMPPNRSLQQYVFPMTIVTGDCRRVTNPVTADCT